MARMSCVDGIIRSSGFAVPSPVHIFNILIRKTIDRRRVKSGKPFAVYKIIAEIIRCL